MRKTNYQQIREVVLFEDAGILDSYEDSDEVKAVFRGNKFIENMKFRPNSTIIPRKLL